MQHSSGVFAFYRSVNPFRNSMATASTFYCAQEEPRKKIAIVSPSHHREDAPGKKLAMVSPFYRSEDESGENFAVASPSYRPDDAPLEKSAIVSPFYGWEKDSGIFQKMSLLEDVCSDVAYPRHTPPGGPAWTPALHAALVQDPHGAPYQYTPFGGPAYGRRRSLRDYGSR